MRKGRRDGGSKSGDYSSAVCWGRKDGDRERERERKREREKGGWRMSSNDEQLRSMLPRPGMSLVRSTEGSAAIGFEENLTQPFPLLLYLSPSMSVLLWCALGSLSASFTTTQRLPVATSTQ